MTIENTAYKPSELPKGRLDFLGLKAIKSTFIDSTKHGIGGFARLTTRVALPLTLLFSNVNDAPVTQLRSAVNQNPTNIESSKTPGQIPEVVELPSIPQTEISDEWTVYKGADYEIECPPMWICQNDTLQGPGIEIGIAKEDTDNFGDHESLYRYLQRVYLPRLINPAIHAFPDNQPKDFSSLITIDFHTTNDKIPNSQSEMVSGKYIFVHHPDGRLFRISYQIPNNLTAETRQQITQAIGSFRVSEAKTQSQKLKVVPTNF